MKNAITTMNTDVKKPCLKIPAKIQMNEQIRRTICMVWMRKQFAA